MTVGPLAQERSAKFLRSSKIKILIPTAFTANSAKAEEYGLSLAGRLGAQVVFFHCIHEALHPVLQTAFSVPNPSPAIRTFFEETIFASLKELSDKGKKAAARGISVTCMLDRKTDSSSDGILQEAARLGFADYYGYTWTIDVVRTFFGRTARDVILGASISVITVRSKRP